MNRRQFLSRTARGLGAGALASSSLSCGSSDQTTGPSPQPGRFSASDVVTLGATGVETSRLAIGTGTFGFNHQSHQSQLGIEALADLMYHGYLQGLTFWDTADSYGTHPHVAEALRYAPRNRVVIQTKSWARTAEEMRADLDRFRQELTTDYPDIVIMHALGIDGGDGDWPIRYQGALEALTEARQAGIIRAHGCSIHSLDALRAAADSPWPQVVLVRLNVAGLHMDAPASTIIPVLEQMRLQRKAIVGIKILGQGELRQRKDEALRYALTVGALDAFSIGAESKAEQDDLVRRIAAVAT